MKKKIVYDPKKELPFAPVDSKITIDLSPETFKQSDEFSKMMDKAHRRAMRDKIGFRCHLNNQHQIN